MQSATAESVTLEPGIDKPGWNLPREEISRLAGELLESSRATLVAWRLLGPRQVSVMERSRIVRRGQVNDEMIPRSGPAVDVYPGPCNSSTADALVAPVVSPKPPDRSHPPMQAKAAGRSMPGKEPARAGARNAGRDLENRDGRKDIVGPGRLWCIAEAAAAIGLSVHTLYTWVSQRKIGFVKAGRRVLFDPDELRKWIDDHRVRPETSN